MFQIFSRVISTFGINLTFSAHEFIVLRELLESIYPQVNDLQLEILNWYRQASCAAENDQWRKFCVEVEMRDLLRLLNSLGKNRYPLEGFIHPLHMNCLFNLLLEKDLLTGEVKLCAVKDMYDTGVWWTHSSSYYDHKNSLEIAIASGVDLFNQKALIEFCRQHF